MATRPESGMSDKVRYMWSLRNKTSGKTSLTKCKASVVTLTGKQEAWLEEQGITVKVMPRNQESLFRAVAEKIFLTQANYEKVKQHVIKYLNDHFSTMEQRVRLAYGKEMAMKPCGQLERDVYEFGNVFGKEPVTPWHAYMYRLANGSNVAGTIEIGAISALYRVNILVFRAIPSAPLVFGKFQAEESDKIKLLNFYGSNHYDLLVTSTSVKSAAVCQSVVYEMLYEKVFGLQNTLAASSAALGKPISLLKPDGEVDEQVKKLSVRKFDRKDPDALNHLKQSLLPFPLKVAKSLDPSSYRDSDLDSK